MSKENDRERKKRINAIFENVGEAVVQIEVLNPATSKLFPGHGTAAPTREEAKEWLNRKARQRKWLAVVKGVTLLAAIVAAFAAVLGLF